MKKLKINNNNKKKPIKENHGHYESREETGAAAGGDFLKRRPAKIVLDKENVEGSRLMHRAPFTLLPAHVVILQQQLQTHTHPTNQTN